MTLLLEARDRTLSRVGVIDDYQKLETILRFNDVDTWVLDMSAKAAIAAAFTPGAGIVVTRNSNVILSGPMRSWSRAWGDQGDIITVGGVSDDVILEDRLARPSAPPYTAAAYDVRTGAAETVLRAYVNNNAGPGAAPERQVTGLSLAADGTHGTTVTGRARFDILGDLLRSLALAGGNLGFRVVQSGGGLIFQVYVPADHSGDVIFSRGLENLRAFTYGIEASESNAVTVGGSGEGTARVFFEETDPTTITRWNRRIETFVDRRDTTDAGELAQAADEEIAGKADKLSLTLTPVDTEAVQYERDYTLGDTVTVEVDDAVFADVIREVHLTVDSSGEVVSPTIGTPSAKELQTKLFDQVRALRHRVRSLERR